jgi:two-component system, NarL family, response regulator DegU
MASLGSPLSPRETDVLRMASRGLTNAEIARRTGITVHTVKFHLAAVYRKLGAANRTEAAALFLHFANGVKEVE